MSRVKDKVCIITGAASGIGKADAEALIREGGKVVLTDVNETAGKNLAETLGPNALFLRLDVSEPADWRRVVANTIDRFGRLDVLVNNAAIVRFGNINQCTLDDYRLINRINNEGVFLGCQAVLPAMEASGGGSIINMSSIAALLGVPSSVAYSAAKGAVAALTRSVAMHCAQSRNNVRCNSIHPGGVMTPMVVALNLGRDNYSEAEYRDAERQLAKNQTWCQAEDIANTVVFFASDESRCINGTQMVVDNAETISPWPSSL